MLGRDIERVIVPVASKEDAGATAAALKSRLSDPGGTLVLVYVVEKAGGAPDKASVEQREAYAEELFRRVRADLESTGVGLETHVLYGTNVAETIIDAAHERDADAVAFTPRGGSRWVKLLTGDVTNALLAESDLPVLVLPDTEGVSAA